MQQDSTLGQQRLQHDARLKKEMKEVSGTYSVAFMQLCLGSCNNESMNKILIADKEGLVDYARDISYYAILLCSSKQPIILLKLPIILFKLPIIPIPHYSSKAQHRPHVIAQVISTSHTTLSINTECQGDN